MPPPRRVFEGGLVRVAFGPAPAPPLPGSDWVGIVSEGAPFEGGCDGTVLGTRLFHCDRGMGLLVKESQLLPESMVVDHGTHRLETSSDAVVADLLSASDMIESLLTDQVEQLKLENAALKAALEAQTEAARRARDEMAPLAAALIKQQELLNRKSADEHELALERAAHERLRADFHAERAKVDVHAISLARLDLVLASHKAFELALESSGAVPEPRADLLAKDLAVSKLALLRRLLFQAGNWPMAKLVSTSLARLWEAEHHSLQHVRLVESKADAALDSLETQTTLASWPDVIAASEGGLDQWTALLDAVYAVETMRGAAMPSLLEVAVPTAQTMATVEAVLLRREPVELIVEDAHRLGARLDAKKLSGAVEQAVASRLTAELAAARQETQRALEARTAMQTERDCALDRISELQQRLVQYASKPVVQAELPPTEPGLWLALRRAREEASELRAREIAQELGDEPLGAAVPSSATARLATAKAEAEARQEESHLALRLTNRMRVPLVAQGGVLRQVAKDRVDAVVLR